MLVIADVSSGLLSGLGVTTGYGLLAVVFILAFRNYSHAWKERSKSIREQLADMQAELQRQEDSHNKDRETWEKERAQLITERNSAFVNLMNLWSKTTNSTGAADAQDPTKFLLDGLGLQNPSKPDSSAESST